MQLIVAALHTSAWLARIDLGGRHFSPMSRLREVKWHVRGHTARERMEIWAQVLCLLTTHPGVGRLDYVFIRQMQVSRPLTTDELPGPEWRGTVNGPWSNRIPQTSSFVLLRGFVFPIQTHCSCQASVSSPVERVRSSTLPKVAG